MCGPEAAGALLVHLSTRRHAVDGHEEHLLRHHSVEQLVNVLEHLGHDVRFRHGPGQSVAMSAVVDDAVHVQVKIIELWLHLDGIHRLAYQRVALAKPAEKLWHACTSRQ